MRQSVTDQAGNVTRYGYDELDRLTVAETKSSAGTVTGRWEYGYDAASNLTRRAATGQATVTPSYNAANQLVDFGGTTFSYDKAGNETASSGTRTTSSYNARGQLTRVSTDSGQNLTREYAGPGQAERVQISDVPLSYTALGLSSFGGGTSSVPESRYVRDPDGRLLSQRTGTSRQYLLLDGLGSVRAGLSTSGSVAWRRDFDPYGRPTSGGDPSNSTSRFGFAGGFWDTAGTYHFGQRFYDPQTGRWTQPDPLNLAADLRQANRYVYVGGDPVNLVDPNGELVPALLAAGVLRYGVIRYGAQMSARTLYNRAYRIGYAEGRAQQIGTAAARIADSIFDKIT